MSINSDNLKTYLEDSYDLNRSIVDEIKEPIIAKPVDSQILAAEEKDMNALQWLKSKFKQGSIKGSIFTLITATIGTGIAVIPNAFMQSGLIFSILQFVFCGWLGYYSLFCVVRCAHHTEKYSYQALALHLYGPWYRNIVNIVFFWANWGTIVAYIKFTCQMLGNTMDAVFQNVDFPVYLQWMKEADNPIMSLVLSTIFVLPLSLAKELKRLTYFCMVSFLFVVYLCILVIVECWAYPSVSFSVNLADTQNFILSGITTTLSTGVFAYMSHPNILDIYRELHNRSLRRMNKVIRRTIYLVFTLYSFVGAFGYISFAHYPDTLSKYAKGVVLVAYGFPPDGTDDPASNYTFPTLLVLKYCSVNTQCCLLIAFSVTIAIPLCVKPTKDSLRDVIYPNATTTPDQDPFGKHFMMVFFCVYSACIVGFFIPSVTTAVNFLGASFFTALCFTMPTSFYLKLTANEKSRHKLDRAICWSLFVFSIILGVGLTTLNILQLVNKK